jgi:hypothetical protein
MSAAGAMLCGGGQTSAPPDYNTVGSGADQHSAATAQSNAVTQSDGSAFLRWLPQPRVARAAGSQRLQVKLRFLDNRGPLKFEATLDEQHAFRVTGASIDPFSSCSGTLTAAGLVRGACLGGPFGTLSFETTSLPGGTTPVIYCTPGPEVQGPETWVVVTVGDRAIAGRSTPGGGQVLRAPIVNGRIDLGPGLTGVIRADAVVIQDAAGRPVAQTIVELCPALQGPDAALLAFSPASHDFGFVTAKSPTADFSFDLVNAPAGALSGTPQFSITGADASSFLITAQGCNAPIPPGKSCPMAVRFNPQGTGTKQARVTVTARAGEAAVADLIGGAGAMPAALSVVPQTVTFDLVNVGSKISRTLTVGNVGGSATGALVLRIRGGDAGDFSIPPASDLCTGKMLAPSETCQALLTFAPGSSGNKVSTLDVQAAGLAVMASLEGSASAPTQPQLSIDPTTNDFGRVLVNGMAAQVFTVTNKGSSTSGAIGVAMTGANEGEFTITDNGCQGGPLTAAASCPIRVSFVPTTVGSKSALLTVGAMPGGSAMSTLTGTGAVPPALTVTPMVATFPNTKTTTVSTATVFTVRNTGVGPTGMIMATANSADFKIVANGCLGSLPPTAMASCTVQVTFQPSVMGTRTGTLSVISERGDHVDVPLDGSGV